MSTINSPKKIIVVLGAGRSGTSLLMRVLTNFGMTVSEKMTQSSVQNPTGTYEDSNIFSVHSDILEHFKTNQYLPLPENWLQTGVTRLSIQKLTDVVRNEVDNAKTIWGFKDPRTALFLAMWNKIFNRTKVVPIYILAVRSPESVVNSLKLQYSYAEEISELFWLHKNCEALFRTGANCFIIHYEEWFSRVNDVMHELLNYTGLKEYCKDTNIEKALQGLINPHLNRSIYEDYTIQNEYVLKLYDVLKTCRGSEFDRSTLMQTVKECRKTMDGFKGWLIQSWQMLENESNKRTKLERQLINETKILKSKEMELERHKTRCFKLKDKLEREISENKNFAERVKDLKQELEKLVQENNRLMLLQKDLFDDNLELSNKIATLSSKSKKLKYNFKEKLKTPKRVTQIIKPRLKKFGLISTKNILQTNVNINSLLFSPQMKQITDHLIKYNKQNFSFMRSVLGRFIWKFKYRDLLKKYSNQELNTRIAKRMENHVKRWGPLAGQYSENIKFKNNKKS
jgi:hypothetical protein